mmetsp:Transcript_33748/g.86545  ORF Transcript_33748/g.86545 Transcript_33748/m.86545 type:complete len:212 (-) Transcript_33748:7-642(-)
MNSFLFLTASTTEEGSAYPISLSAPMLALTPPSPPSPPSLSPTSPSLPCLPLSSPPFFPLFPFLFLSLMSSLHVKGSKVPVGGGLNAVENWVKSIRPSSHSCANTSSSSPPSPPPLSSSLSPLCFFGTIVFPTSFSSLSFVTYPVLLSSIAKKACRSPLYLVSKWLPYCARAWWKSFPFSVHSSPISLLSPPSSFFSPPPLSPLPPPPFDV